MGEVIQFPGHGPRLRALSDRHRDAAAAARLAQQQRDRAIVEAIDDGHPQQQAARDCQLAPATITRILSMQRREPGEELPAAA